MTTWQPRMLRAAVFATACVAMSATAHAAMAGDGAALPWPVLLAAFAGTAGGSWLLGGRRRPFAVGALWMTAAQAALHLLFECAPALSAPTTVAVRPGPVDWTRLLLCTRDPAALGRPPEDLARAAGLDPEALALSGLPTLPQPGGHSGGGHGLHAAMDPAAMAATTHGVSAGMLAGHLLAALACALLLWRGEAAITGVFDLLGTLAAVLVPALLLLRPWRPRPVPALRPAWRAVRTPRSALLSSVLVRRGPPGPLPIA
ncbi:hypothetical protein [Kitasatospora camelliae]|uniref:PE-PGRS family protein n=1 Tax=Kitasatospora camelliae TaxID=3156397 RepID=A0AAU8K4X9_9ACTN